jgi:hypothetical protein
MVRGCPPGMGYYGLTNKNEMLNRVQKHDKQGCDDSRQGRIQHDNKGATIWVGL